MTRDDSVPSLAGDAEYRRRRDERYKALYTLRRITRLKRLDHCRRVVKNREEGVTLRLTGEAGQPGARAGISGLQTCGSVWACPVCSEKVNTARQAELVTAMEKWTANGHALAFLTLTVRHNKRQSLARLWEAISPAWNRVAAGASWSGNKKTLGDKARFGIHGFVRLVEVTHGDENGWHPHLHVLLFLKEELTDQQMEDLRARLYRRWELALASEGLSAVEWHTDPETGVTKAVGVDLRRVEDGLSTLAEYFTKMGYRAKNAPVKRIGGAAYEVTGSHSKRAAPGSRSPFQILADLVAVRRETVGFVDESTGEVLESASSSKVAADLRLWHEWETTSLGKRQLTWSRGLRDELGLGKEDSDEDIVEADDLTGMHIIGDL